MALTLCFSFSHHCSTSDRPEDRIRSTLPSEVKSAFLQARRDCAVKEDYEALEHRATKIKG
jgi:hypothetical protein